MQKENRNIRAHTEGQSGKTDFLIEGLLPVGKENAVTTQELVKMLPYVVTIIVLIITSKRNKQENQPPSSLGEAYFREDR